MAKQTIKLLDLTSEIKGNKNVSKSNIIKVIRALIRVMGNMKSGFRIDKDRLAKSTITNEVLHIPQHIRFKATFYDEFKRFLNKG